MHIIHTHSNTYIKTSNTTIPYSHFPLSPMLGVITLVLAVACYYGMSEPPFSGES